MKVVINNDYGGFGLSEKAVRRGRELGMEWAFKCVLPGEYYSDGSGPCNKTAFNSFTPDYDDEKPNEQIRSDPELIKVVEELGLGASGRFSRLKVVEIPDGIDFSIEEYDGNEWIAEKHRRWG